VSTDSSSDETPTASDAAHCASCGAPLPEGASACPECTETFQEALKSSGTGSSVPRRVANYTIVRELGAGGMGTVFEAFDETMRRTVALKILPRTYGPSARMDQRFAQEAWIAGKLTHKNLVKVYERGTWEEISFYAMELVDGGSLAEVVGRMRRDGRDARLGLEYESPQYVRWAVEQAIQAAEALDHAHRHGVVHRDIKPMNLLLDREAGILKIADFGLAISLEATRLTSDGRALGTPVYMAPEQILGKQREIDGRADIYALGVTLFELLTLQLPYLGETQPLYFNAVLTHEARRAGGLNRRVGRDLEVVIHKALEKDPRDRYATAGAFAADLQNVLSLRPIQAVPPGRLQRVVKWARRKPVHAVLVGVLVVVTPIMALLAQRALDQRRLLQQVKLAALHDELRRFDQLASNRGRVATATRILEQEPEDTQARRTRSVGAMYLALQRRPGDAAAAAEMEKLALEDADTLIKRFPEAAWPYELKEFLASQLGRSEAARAAHALAQERAKANPSKQDEHLGALNALDQGDPQRAVTLLTSLIDQRPDLFFARMDRAHAYEKLGQLDEAMRDYNVALGLNPRDGVARLNLGILETQAGKPEEGTRLLEGVHEASAAKNQALSFNLLARGRAVEGDAALDFFRRAEKEAREGLTRDPDLPWLHINLGASLMEQHRLGGAAAGVVEEATQRYTKAVELTENRRDPDGLEMSASALSNLCDQLIQTADLDRALQICTQTTKRFPQKAEAFYNLAGVHALAGRAAQALAALEQDFALGDRDGEYLARDPWFVSLRGTPEFSRLVQRMKDDGR
jgi:tetratricopeptide (TPR) repeat protein